MDATTTAALSAVATTTGELISDGYPLFLMLLGIFIALFGFGLFWQSVRGAARRILR